jgi:hypothetical protein
MSNLRFGLVALLGITGLSAVACNSDSSGGAAPRPIGATAATTAMNQRVEELIAGLGDSAAQLDTTDSTSVATQGVRSALGTSSACTASGSAGGGSTGSTGGTVDAVPASTTNGLRDFLHQVAKEARAHVFREEFVEVDDGNKVVYKINPASACGTDTSCIEKLTQNPVRFAVTANTDDELDVSLIVGEARHTPGTAVLGPKKLSVRVDLAEAMATVRLFTSAADQQSFPERLDGVLEGSIDKRAEGDFAISGSVLEKFDLVVGQAKGKRVAVTVLPSSPTSQITINAVTNTLGYATNLGAVDVQVAGAAVCDDQCGTKERTGTFSAHLGGFTGTFAVTNATTDLTFSGVGLGNDTSHVDLNNDRLGTLDVNAKNGRTFTVSFKKTAEGTLVTFEPALDIKLGLMLNKLSESLRVDMPTWLSDEIFEVLLGAAAKPSVLIPAPTCDALGRATSKSELKVVTGNLSLSSSSLSTPVTVAAGMCLVPVKGVASGANPMSYLQAGTCQ